MIQKPFKDTAKKKKERKKNYRPITWVTKEAKLKKKKKALAKCT